MEKKKLGIILIGVGLFILLSTLNLIGEDMFLYLLSGGFLFAYFSLGAREHYRNIGFLIPGTVLLAVALFSDLQNLEFFNMLGGGLFFILLGLAFFIVFIHTSAFTSWDWPIYPAVSLILFGIFMIFLEKNRYLAELTYLNHVISVILIAAGIFILFRQNKNK
jgi:hypothetical protein